MANTSWMEKICLHVQDGSPAVRAIPVSYAFLFGMCKSPALRSMGPLNSNNKTSVKMDKTTALPRKDN